MSSACQLGLGNAGGAIGKGNRNEKGIGKRTHKNEGSGSSSLNNGKVLVAMILVRIEAMLLIISIKNRSQIKSMKQSVKISHCTQLNQITVKTNIISS